MSWQFEVLQDELGGVTEGPVWDGSGLLFTHIPTSRILRYDPNAETIKQVESDTARTNGLALDAQGRLFGCAAGVPAIVLFGPGGRVVLPNRLEGAVINGPNDLAVDSRGRIWFTDPYGRGESPEGHELDHTSVLRLDPDPEADEGYRLSRATYSTVSPNGILISQDETWLYIAVGGYRLPARELRAYPIGPDGALGSYRTLHTFGREYFDAERRDLVTREYGDYVARYGADALGVHRGIDGMCLDEDGNIVAAAGWAQAGPGPMIYVFSPLGRVLETHPVPFMPTNCCFGGPGSDDFYLTTADGSLLRARATGRRGWLPHLTG